MFSKTSQKKKWFLLCLLCLCFLGCNVLLGCNTAPTDQQEVALADIWAKAWQTRDGKPRYEIMNQEMQQQFKQQQKEMSGSEDTWNIRWSSPWPENYFIDIETKDGEKTALITYTYTDSAGDKYEGKERLFFAQENGNLVVAAADMEVEMETLVLDFPAKIKAIQYYRQGQKQTIDLQSDLGKRLIHEYYRMLGQIQGFSALAEAENQDDATKTKEGTALEFLFAEPVSLASFTNLGNEMPDDLSATLTSLAADNKTTLLQSGGQYGQYTIFTEKHYIKTLAELVAKQTTSF